ncbi:uncharacterized protein LOC143030101 [Oratosquilla oratoria]|uniref:uncharacterized protein LOC143030101 n=1 Tax=Oratosquilla oratoria TaxID=337810 RepID=UPI003F775DF2
MATYTSFIFAAACVLSLVLGTPTLPRTRRDSSPLNYELPGNATNVLTAPITTGFDCEGRVYGYYADVQNNCEIFHICFPYVDSDFVIKNRMFSFVCGQGLVFDQLRLVCSRAANALPCQAAENFYTINNYFGRVDLKFGEDEIPEIPKQDFTVQTFNDLRQNL